MYLEEYLITIQLAERHEDVYFSSIILQGFKIQALNHVQASQQQSALKTARHETFSKQRRLYCFSFIFNGENFIITIIFLHFLVKNKIISKRYLQKLREWGFLWYKLKNDSATKTKKVKLDFELEFHRKVYSFSI